MQGVQAGGHLHALGAVHGIPVGHIDARQLQRRTATGEGVLHHQVLRLLSVHKGRDVGALFRHDGFHAFDALLRQLTGNARVGPGGNLVNHDPGEGHLLLVLHPGHKALGHKPAIRPASGDSGHGGADLLAVVAAVVHAHQGDGRRPRLIAGVEHGRGHAHGVPGAVRAAFQVGAHHGQKLALQIRQRIALFGDGVGHHLQLRAAEHRLQLFPVLPCLRRGGKTAGHGGNHLPAGGTVGQQRDHEGHAVVGLVDLLKHIRVKGFRHHNAAANRALIQQALLQPRDKSAENVAPAEVYPHGVFLRIRSHLRPVVARQRHARCGPGIRIPKAFIAQLHLTCPPSCGTAPPTDRSDRLRPGHGHTGRNRGGRFRPRSCGRGRGGCRYPGRYRRWPP